MKRAILLLLLIITTSITALAQRFPVAVNVQVNQPSPIYFANYADGSTINSPLRVQLVLSDLSIVNRQIGLRVFFEGNGIQFQSTDVVVGAAPLFIDGGIPLNLTNVELAPYFEFQNIQGINPNTYGAAIREGSYQICFEVYDVATQNRLSSKSCATTYIFQNEPPILTLPTKNYTIDANQVQNFVFQWTPRHINVSNVQYELSMVEVWDERVDPQTAFLSSPPVFVTTTTNTSFRYGPGQPQLLPNKRYAWRIQAKALQGTEEIGLFKNNGYSEIYWFNYTAPCLAPNNVSAEVKGIYKANIYWDETFDTTMAYEVRYREANNPNAQWFTTRSSEAWATLWDLKPNTTYEYQVTTVCELDKSPYTNQSTFTTDTVEDQESYYNCGISPDITLANKEPLEQLYVDEVFTAGDFPVKVTEINGSNGRFSGKGYVTVPYLDNFRISVKFTNAFINTEKQLAEGMVVTTYDPSMKGIVDADEVIKDIVDITEDVGDAIKGGDDHEHTVDFEIEEIVVKDGQIIVKGTNGEEATFDHDEEDTYEITGTDKVYSVNKDNEITEIGDTAPGGEATASNTNGISESPMPDGNGSVVSEVATDAIVITFRNGTTDESKYGLDRADNAYERQTYPKTKDAKGNDYYPIHKAVVNNTTEVLYADIEIKNSEIAIDSLIFKTVSGLALDAKRVDGKNSYKISLEGKNGYREQEAIVTYKDASGKQNVAVNFYIHHLGKRAPIKVKVVRINNAKPIADIGQKINAIYGVAGVDFAVEAISEPFSIPEDAWDTDVDNGKIDYDGSGLLANYPKELREIHNYYKKNTSNFDDEAYYLFIIDKATEVTKPLGGFMPKTRQYGYLFERYYESDGLENKDTPAQIAAHELGHGVFSLAHPFPEGGAGADTDWLMDYNNGTQLPYPHWAGINDVGVKLHFFQDDEGAEYNDGEYFEKLLQQIRCAYISGQDAIDIPQKYIGIDKLVIGSFTYGLDSDETINGAKISIATVRPMSDATTIAGIKDAKTRNANSNGKLTFSGFDILVTNPSYDQNTGISPIQHFMEYLFPAEVSVKADFDLVWNSGIGTKVNTGETLLSNEIDQLKRIASCGTKYLDITSRYKLLKAIFNYSTREYYEDLVLDIFTTITKGQESKKFFELINKDKVFLERLVDKMNNYGILSNAGGSYEHNFDRLAIEYLNLFYKAYETNELERIYSAVSDENKLFFYGFGVHCQSTVSASRDDQIFSFEEREITKYYPPSSQTKQIAILTGSAALGSCDHEDREFTIAINDFVAVDFVKEAKLNAEVIDKGIYVMPALVYYTIIRSKINQDIKMAIEAATMITPIDEFFIIGQAIKYGNMGFRAIRFSRVAARSKQIFVSLKRVPTAMQDAIRNSRVTKLDDKAFDWSKQEFGEYLDISANPVKPLISNAGGDALGSIVRNGSKVEYTNPAGKLLKWTEQNIGDIDNAILTAKNLDASNPKNLGRIIEAKVGTFVKQQKQLDGYAVSIKRANNSPAGDIDISTLDELIEVKKSFSAWSGKKGQVNKFVNSSMDDFLNPNNKKVILYIDELLTAAQKSTITNYIPSNVTLVNSLSELKSVLK